jgi:hypothetical protein
MYLRKQLEFMPMEIIKPCILMIYFERFGRRRKYALGKTSGKANIEKNLQELGLQLNRRS